MVRPKTKDWERKGFSLDIDTIQLIKQGKILNGLKSEGAFVDFAVNQYFINSDPMKELDSINAKKESLRHELEVLELKERECMERINFIQKWRQNGFMRKKTIIQNLAKFILQGRKMDAEDIAVVQSARLGIPKEQLLMEACEVAGKI